MKSKRKEYLFVDGYNIINAWDDLKALNNVSLEASRQELIEVMSEYKAYTDKEVIIVFDAHLQKGSIQKKESVKGVTIVYTKEKETADQYIEKTLDSIGRSKTVRVATSDWVEQQIVLGRGGTRVSARELKLEIQSIKRQIKRKNLDKNETNDMLMGRLDPEIVKKLQKWRKND